MDIRQRLFGLQDLKYRDFQVKLIPGIDLETVIGIRTPALRGLAKEVKDTPEAEDFLNELPHQYYDENNLHGMLISQMKDYERCVEELDRFLPYVDNWATCDLIRPKVFKKHLGELLPHVKRWITSDAAYTIRFGMEMLMTCYLDDAFEEEYLEWVASVRSEEYYVNMMIAWFFATALAKQYEKTLPFIKEQRLDRWTHNKAIQKAIESYRITPEQKADLRSFRLSPTPF